VQKQIQTEMWMYPVDAAVARADVMKFAPEPAQADAPAEQELSDKGAAWVARWTKVVLK
jgi:thiamine transport system substrate-binding protein